MYTSIVFRLERTTRSSPRHALMLDLLFGGFLFLGSSQSEVEFFRLMDYEIRRGAQFLSLAEGQYVLKTRYESQDLNTKTVENHRVHVVPPQAKVHSCVLAEALPSVVLFLVM